VYRITVMYLGRNDGISNVHSLGQYPRTAVGHSDRLADDWDRERDKHQKTLNGSYGTCFSSTGTSHREAATQDWPCVDSTSCEIQLSLVEQQQKLLNQKRLALERSRTALHTSLHNGHSDMRTHPVLRSLDNKHLDEKYVSANRSFQSKSQREFPLDTDLYDGVGSRGGWSHSADDSRTDVKRIGHPHVDVPAYKPSPDIPSTTVIPDRVHAGEREFDVSEEVMRKKQKRLHHLHGSQKSGKLHSLYLKFCYILKQYGMQQCDVSLLGPQFSAASFSKFHMPVCQILRLTAANFPHVRINFYKPGNRPHMQYLSSVSYHK